MSKLHDDELADTIAAERAKRTRRGRRLQAVSAAQKAAVCTDPTYQRILAVLPDESPVDLEGHAARITLVVHKAREHSPLPPAAWTRKAAEEEVA